MTSFGGHFDIDQKRERLNEITQMETMDGFWEDASAAGKIQKEKSVLEEVVATYDQLKDLADEFDVLVEFVESEGDENSASEGIEVYEKFIAKFLQAEQKGPPL